MRKINAVIFDLDGTLISFEINFMEARQKVIEKLIELEIPKEILSPKKRILDMIREVEYHINIIEKNPQRVPYIKKKIEKIIIKYEMDGARKTKLMPSAKDLLSFLKSNNYKIGLFTLENRKITNYILKRFSIDLYFNSIITRDDVINFKPHPDHLKLVLKQLNVASDEVIVIGDHPVDLECGKQINAITVAYLSSRHNRDNLINAGADHVIENLLEIEAILKKML